MSDQDFIEIVVEHVAHDANSIGIRLHEGAPTKWIWLPQSGIDAHVGDPMPGFVSLRMPRQVARERRILP